MSDIKESSAEAPAREFAHFVKGLGFRVWLDKTRRYGFISDDAASRVLSFSFRDGALGGNYGPATQQCGTGWRMETRLSDLRAAEDVRRALYAMPPHWVRDSCRGSGDGWQYLTTVAQHLAMYGKSSGYEEVTE